MAYQDEKRRKKQQQEEARNAFKYEYDSQSDFQRKLAAQYKTAADMTLVIQSLT